MEEPYKYSYHWISHNWLVWMYPKEFARPVKQKVLAQAKGYACVCKQLLLLGICNAFLWRSFCLEAFASFYAVILTITNTVLDPSADATRLSPGHAGGEQRTHSDDLFNGGPDRHAQAHRLLRLQVRDPRSRRGPGVGDKRCLSEEWDQADSGLPAFPEHWIDSFNSTKVKYRRRGGTSICILGICQTFWHLQKWPHDSRRWLLWYSNYLYETTLEIIELVLVCRQKSIYGTE